MLKCRSAIFFGTKPSKTYAPEWSWKNTANNHCTDPSLDSQDWQWNPTVQNQIRRATQLALQAEHSTGKPQTALLLELDATASQLMANAAEIYEIEKGMHWSSHMHSCRLLCKSCPSSFFAYAISNGLTSFVEAQLTSSTKAKAESEKISPLVYAIWDCPLSARKVLAYPAMVSMLLRAGFNPNDRSSGSTPWQDLLKFIRKKLANCSASALSATFDSAWVDTCKLFILYGADVRADERDGEQFPSVWETLEPAFRHLSPEPLRELKTMIKDGELRSDSASQTAYRDSRSQRQIPKHRMAAQKSNRPRRRRYHNEKSQPRTRCDRTKDDDYRWGSNKPRSFDQQTTQDKPYHEFDGLPYHTSDRDHDNRFRSYHPFPRNPGYYDRHSGSRGAEWRKCDTPWVSRPDMGYPARWRPY